jgi:hypothetical protein
MGLQRKFLRENCLRRMCENVCLKLLTV